MRYSEIITETLDQTIMMDAEREIKATIKKFCKDNYVKYVKMLGAEGAMKKLDDFGTYKDWEDLPWQEQSKKMDKRSNLLDAVLSMYSQIQPGSDRFYEFKEEIEPAFVDALETCLQKVATEAVEKKYGKIDKIRPGSYIHWEDRIKHNLHHTQHIIVKIDLNGYARGKKQDGGGHFQSQPQGAKEKYETGYSKNVDWHNDLVVAIKLFSSDEKIMKVILSEFKRMMENDLMGETFDYDNYEDKFLQPLLSTFVHECVHLFQHVEKSNSTDKNPRMIGPGITYTPVGGKRAKKFRFDKDGAKGKYYRGGKRKADYLGGDEDPEDERYENYFGAPHEIEAHAAGAASGMVYEFIQDQKSYAYRHQIDQSRINEFVDSQIDNLKNGYFDIYGDNRGSLSSYFNYIREKITYADAKITKDGRQLPPKIDTMHRKVWRKFLLRLISALQAYKKELPIDPYYDETPEWKTRLAAKRKSLTNP